MGWSLGHPVPGRSQGAPSGGSLGACFGEDQAAFTFPSDRLVRLLRWVVGVGQASDPVAEVLKAYARYSPIPIRVNGRQINLERQGHWKHLTILNRPPLHLRPITSMRHFSLDKDVPFAGYLGTGVGGGGVLVIVDCLLYPLELPEAPEDFRAIRR